MENPKIRFKGYTKDWEQRKLKEIADKVSEKNKNNEFSEPFTNSAEQGIISQKDYFDREIVNNENLDSYYIVRNDDFIYNPRISVTAPVGPINRNRLGRNGVMSPLYTVFRTHDIDNLYLEFYFKTTKWHRFMKLNGDSGARFDRFTISSTQFMEMPIPYPMLDEQRKMGEYFDSLDHLITLHQRKCEQTKKLKKYMLQKMFPQNGAKVPEIRFDGFTYDWEQRKLGDMGSTFTGLSGKTKEDFGHGDAQFITYMNVFSNPVANLEMTEAVEIDAKQNRVKKGDVFFTTSSETPEEVGMSCVMPENKDNIYLNSFCFGYRPTEKFDLDYLAYVLRADSFRKEMKFLAQGISRYNISKNKVMEVSIPIPNLEEQTMVGRYFSTLDHLITLHQRKCDELKKMKKYMLQNMFI